MNNPRIKIKLDILCFSFFLKVWHCVARNRALIVSFFKARVIFLHPFTPRKTFGIPFMARARIFNYYIYISYFSVLFLFKERCCRKKLFFRANLFLIGHARDPYFFWTHIIINRILDYRIYVLENYKCFVFSLCYRLLFSSYIDNTCYFSSVFLCPFVFL